MLPFGPWSLPVSRPLTSVFVTALCRKVVVAIFSRFNEAPGYCAVASCIQGYCFCRASGRTGRFMRKDGCFGCIEEMGIPSW
ncbi:hypothetical protein C8J56DRAFT_944112 [Mycena floridula]|nr:hypothetical protein C8J56DRAFT_944112 [Mycena floridula]